MLRRDFFKAALAFTAAAASAKAVVAAASPQEKAGEWLRDKFLCARCDPPAGGAALVPPEFVAAIEKELEKVSQFERTLVDCIRDGSLVLVGVTGHSVGYEAFYRPARTPGEHSREQHHHDSLMAMHDRGLIIVEDVTAWNNYDAFSVRFAICPATRSQS